MSQCAWRRFVPTAVAVESGRVGFCVVKCWIFALATALSMVPPTLAISPDSRVVQPTNYVSPSGVFALFVDPAHRKGLGAAQYRLTRNGGEVWSGEKEYTLREVTVTDHGLAVGMAYRELPRDEYERRSRDRFMHITILGADGREILNDVKPCGEPRMHASRLPYVTQLLVDPANDRLIARVRARGAQWWTYRLSTGASLSQVDTDELTPDFPNVKFVIKAWLVPDTPLTLVHWYTKGPEFRVRDDGAAFVLSDEELRPVWSLDAASDYHRVDFGWTGLRRGPAPYFERDPAIVLPSSAGRFDIRLFAERKQVSFFASRAPGGEWNVRELGRIDFPPEATEQSVVVPTAEQLRYLGEVKLNEGAGGAKSPFRDLLDFTFDNKGLIYFIKIERGETRTAFQCDRTGTVISEHDFEFGKVYWPASLRNEDGRFLVRREKKSVVEHGYDVSYAWANLATNREEALNFELLGRIDSITILSDGAVLVLENLTRRSAMVNRLTCFNADGSTRWFIDDDGYKHERLGIGPTDVTVTSTGRIVLLGKSYVRILDLEGATLKEINISRGASKVIADNDGGFLIANSNTPPEVLRFHEDGTIRSRWSPRHPNGKTFDLRPRIRVAPDGRLWTGDGDSIMRLTDDGVVDLVLGPEDDADAIHEIVAFTVDSRGNLYAVAKGSGNVHVFNRTGVPKHVLRPDPADVPGTVDESFVAVTDRGEVYIKKPSTIAFRPPDEYLRFSPSGERLPPVKFKPSISVGRFVGSVWAFQPETGYRCGVARSGRRLVMVDPPDTLIHEEHRRPNGEWFGDRTMLAMAPDGSMAVLGHGVRGMDTPHEVDLFSAEGKPIRTMRLPPPRKKHTGIAYDGKRVVVADHGEIVLLDTATGDAKRYPLEVALTPRRGLTEERWSVFLMPGAEELLLFDHPGSRIHRYALPTKQASATPPPPVIEAPPDPDDAAIQSSLAEQYLEVLAALPERGPCIIYTQDVGGGCQPVTEAQAMELPEEERAALRTINLDEREIGFDRPRVYARLLDIAANYGMDSLEGKRAMDYGCCDIRHLQALARLGVDVLGVWAGRMSQRTACNDGDDVGDLIGLEGRVGHLQIPRPVYLTPEELIEFWGAEFDLITFRNIIQDTKPEDYLVHGAWKSIAKVRKKKEIVEVLFDALRPGGYLLTYNVTVDATPPENAFDRELWESAGFEVLAFDQEDRGAALGLGQELGWEVHATPLMEHIRAMYTLVRRPSDP